ncbi:hypothetical protein ABC347_14235 [Sphingomonas sp. 1P06PA]|uniref:hypothetical protein n=1 Tax=Sphingomonas sp. 1P06PA TaxID=554121 RepID=UPI0039A559A8
MPDAGAGGHRCRLCTANDHNALIEHIAIELWESRRHGTLDDWPWDQAGYWQDIMRELARSAVRALQR